MGQCWRSLMVHLMNMKTQLKMLSVWLFRNHLASWCCSCSMMMWDIFNPMLWKKWSCVKCFSQLVYTHFKKAKKMRIYVASQLIPSVDSNDLCKRLDLNWNKFFLIRHATFGSTLDLIIFISRNLHPQEKRLESLSFLCLNIFKSKKVDCRSLFLLTFFSL